MGNQVKSAKTEGRKMLNTAKTNFFIIIADNKDSNGLRVISME